MVANGVLQAPLTCRRKIKFPTINRQLMFPNDNFEDRTLSPKSAERACNLVKLLCDRIGFVCLCWGFTAQSTTRSCRAGQ